MFDLGEPQLTCDVTASIHITVLDVNDCMPRFHQSEYNVSLLVPLYADARITQVTRFIQDLDSICFKLNLNFGIFVKQNCFLHLFSLEILNFFSVIFCFVLIRLSVNSLCWLGQSFCYIVRYVLKLQPFIGGNLPELEFKVSRDGKKFSKRVIGILLDTLNNAKSYKRFSGDR